MIISAEYPPLGAGDLLATLAGKLVYFTDYESLESPSPQPRPISETSGHAPLGRQLPPGPWRSLGGYLDYENWPARERFLELDAAISREAQT